MSENVIPGYSYTLLDHNQTPIGDFESLTGGNMSISMVEYNLVFDTGSSTTRFIPGQTSFAPITLSRGLSSGCKESYELFMKASGGEINYQNMTVAIKDENLQDRVLWHLTNVILTGVGGFLFNKEYIAEFRVTLQPESIEMEFL